MTDTTLNVCTVISIAYCDVFALPECVGAESIARLIAMLFGIIVVENPACVLRAARFVQQPSALYLIAPGPVHTAMFAMLLPDSWIKMSGVIERSDKFVTVSCRPIRKDTRTR